MKSVHVAQMMFVLVASVSVVDDKLQNVWSWISLWCYIKKRFIFERDRLWIHIFNIHTLRNIYFIPSCFGRGKAAAATFTMCGYYKTFWQILFWKDCFFHSQFFFKERAGMNFCIEKWADHFLILFSGPGLWPSNFLT